MDQKDDPDHHLSIGSHGVGTLYEALMHIFDQCTSCNTAATAFKSCDPITAIIQMTEMTSH